MSDTATCAGCPTELPPNRVPGRQRKWCSEACRKRTCYSGTCIDCGTALNASAGNGPNAPKRCPGCSSRHIVATGTRADMVRAAARRQRIQEQWLAGAALKDIARIVESTPKSINSTIAGMRKAGWDLPYRRSGPWGTKQVRE